MRLKVLGAYGAADATHNLTGYLLEDRIAVDAGTMTSKLSLAQQSRIESIFITHAHADHIRDLPHLIVNRFNLNAPPLNIIASREVMERLTGYVFNGEVWPDFEKIVSPETGKPAIHYRAVASGKRTKIGDIYFTAVNVDHSVPAAGVILEIAGQAITFTGDTSTTTQIWKKTNQTENYWPSSPRLHFRTTTSNWPSTVVISRRRLWKRSSRRLSGTSLFTPAIAKFRLMRK